tara:strand:+ start:307 stop:432 length:126 start_codon:yes stop_codon:yes gene_type:complete
MIAHRTLLYNDHDIDTAIAAPKLIAEELDVTLIFVDIGFLS